LRLEVEDECLQGGFDVGDVALHLVQAVLVVLPVLALFDAVREPLLFELARGADPFPLGWWG
jgi:hypothetical protein